MATEYLYRRELGGPTGRTICFVGLAPLPVGATHSTLLRYESWMHGWGYHRAVALNVHPIITTSCLDGLGQWARSPEAGPAAENARQAMLAAKAADLVVACWGGSPLARRSPAREQLLQSDIDLWCLGMTKDGSPVHPAARFLPRLPTLTPYRTIF